MLEFSILRSRHFEFSNVETVRISEVPKLFSLKQFEIVEVFAVRTLAELQ